MVAFSLGFLIGIISIVAFVCVVFVTDDDGGDGDKRKKLRVGYNCVVEVDQEDCDHPLKFTFFCLNKESDRRNTLTTIKLKKTTNNSIKKIS